MKAILVNKFNFPKGGADKYFLELATFLAKEKGNKVAKFCMQHPDNLPDRYSKYFISQVDYNKRGCLERLRSAGRALWSWEAARKFEKLIKDFKPDLVHIHNIYHQLSPSILPVAKRHGLPVIMHVHDYKLISPNYKLFANGKIDESSTGGQYWRCLLNNCVKESPAMSWLAVLEMYLHHKWLKVYEHNIDCFVAPSKFVRDKLIVNGWPADKIKVIPYGIAVPAKSRAVLGDYILFFGRLEEEKGGQLLIKAVERLRGKMKLKIVGSGPDRRHLVLLAKELGISERVEFVGPKHGEELQEIIAGAYLVVVPSIWYEVFGLVNLEAAALGKLVLAADIGGISEVIKDHQSGLLFKAGSETDLATKLDWCIANPKMVTEFGLASAEYVKKHFSLEKHEQAIRELYQKLLAKG